MNTLSSRRVHVDDLCPLDTVLSLKQRLEDTEGVPVEDQELRRVNLDGATEAIMRDEQQLHETGVRSGDTVFWVNAKDGDVSLFSAGNNSDGCRMASSAGSEVLTVQEEEGGSPVADGNWWDRSGSSSGVLSVGRALSAARTSASADAIPGLMVTDDRSDGFAGDQSPVERARVAQAAEARAARRGLMANEQQEPLEVVAAATTTKNSSSSILPVGQRVKIFGLLNPNAQHLNGTHGTVLTYIPELQRYQLQLDGAAGKAKLKGENLQIIKSPKRASAARARLRGSQPKITRGVEDTGDVALDVRAMVAEELAKCKSRHHSVTARDAGGACMPAQAGSAYAAGAHSGASSEVEAIDREHALAAV